ncbi:branched-chain amino acid ABC transporter substrate-binding protein [Allocoleopsis franciscana]|uniref:Amino acid/amide ABC transporter substrate-binding protein, HAAT family n=1 Tax=Allocoleopsis franciscana PCC 7113 TaxID=1173027 RepID=K9W9I0_9CYAN|nr:branched-chain amino acid ABC transporter substrate-binding protein [Allocoleopsis franciscana]AFZ16137.1 amino acid/amide ABC transporter substrate-binding protein, HAAT family [Allocoleopsis franciscana PCC 7113]
MSKLALVHSLKPRSAMALALTTLATGVLAAACTGNQGGTTADGNTVKIVSSLPMTGSGIGQNQTIVNGIKQVLDETNSTACDGKVKITYESYDDATAAAGKWDPAQVTSNANKAVADKSVVAVIGHFNSGAAKLSIPILNKSNLVMVSPANTYPGLTKPGKGEANEPNIYYPNGKRNYARVVPADDLQGVAGAKWAKSLGAKKVFILDDQELYGKGLADIFEATAKKEGLQVLGHEGIDAKASDYKALMTKIKALGPDLIYFGGTTQTNAGQLIKDMRNVGMSGDKVKFMGPDGIFEKALIDAAGKDAEGVYATFGGVPAKELKGTGQKWYESYKKKYAAEPEAYAAYGYESAKVIVDAINKVCKNDRDAIREAVLNTKDFNGVLGTWSFDPNGDTTLTTLSGNVVKNGKWEFVSVLKAQ